ncbi:RluA family pseudouridine synthase [Robbsia sp. Bb-Pol-6]|uniref:Ribosomal large subunit pseudouridine synthase D n=1 Tax=Robbsia betulipollinis TaxID=2981849 RepID=A0ABT3ZPA5_9BURK|nr:RluA family pseudouridine synthase [Robbsia betulipollinis]MCY0388065.1 RluA family pseudouridine synthase [Robbsia betulipollinis]
MTRSAADYSPTPVPSDPITGNAEELDALFTDDDLLDAGESPVSPPSAPLPGTGRRPLNEPLEPLEPLRGHVPAALAGERLDKVLARLFPDFSRGRLQTWLEAGRVTIDGVVARPRQGAAADALLVVVPQHAPETLAFTAEPVPLDIVYEDAALVVINKPAGLVVHPGAGNWTGTLLNGLLYHYGEQASSLPRAGIVHRLDKETSGLMVVARTLTAQTDLVRQLQARTVKRRYVCAVWGNPPSHGTIDAPIGRDPRDRMKMAVVHGNAGKAARTHFETVSTGRLGERAVAALHCDLETGRTHQIRVHCRHIGHPLVGDPVYGGPTRTTAAPAAPSGFARQALHAFELGLRHPDSGEMLSWRAPAPADLLRLAAQAELDLGIGGDDGVDDDLDGDDHDVGDDDATHVGADDATYDELDNELGAAADGKPPARREDKP